MRLLVLALTLAIGAVNAVRAGEAIIIQKGADLNTPPIPIAIIGFTGDVAAVLRFDLAIMGFTNVPPESASYILSGNNTDSTVQAQLKTGNVIKTAVGMNIQAQQTLLFSKSYQGNDVRAQAHKLADDTVEKITGVPGIAEKNGQIARIAFKVDKGDSSEIYISDFDGHAPTPATQDGSITAAPAWVPGRFAIYYTSYKVGYPHIFYQNLSTGERRNFAHFPGLNSSATVSPDGRKVAMILSKGGNPDLWVCDADGGNLTQLTKTREDESSPCWSPDGRTICFVSKLNERQSLYKISLDGGPMERIPTGVGRPSEPDWSPDGRWIVFTASGRNFDICVVPAGGGTATVLVAGEDPSWAPNSRTVIFVRRAGGRRTLSLLDVPTKQVKDASRVPGSNYSSSQPSWAR